MKPLGVRSSSMTATQRDGIKQMQNGDPIWDRIRRETREAAALRIPRSYLETERKL